ncbi:Ubiquinone/menaquinone biosynthesis C-methyltransferase UbiE [compost metagenome]
MYRVLKPEGKIVILEFSKPRAFPIKQGYNFYSQQVLPFFGKVFSKDSRAYTYLPESVAAFPDGEDFIKLMDKVGFKKSKDIRLTFGISAIYTGVK